MVNENQTSTNSTQRNNLSLTQQYGIKSGKRQIDSLEKVKRADYLLNDSLERTSISDNRNLSDLKVGLTNVSAMIEPVF